MVEKHECFHYAARSETLQLDGESIELKLPEWAVRFEVVEAQRTSTRLFLILRDLETQGWDDNLGIVAIATRQPDGSYAVVFWHATYPYIWSHL